MKYNIEEFEFRQCNEKHLEDILQLQKEAFFTLPDKTLLRHNPPELLERCLIDPNYTLGVFCDNKLIAIGVLFDGGLTDSNLGKDVGFTEEELYNVINAKLFIVSEKYRGNGLQQLLIEKLVEKAKEKGKEVICASVSPDNLYSIRNFEKCGFLFHSEKIKYGGMRRSIYYKNI